MVLSKRLDLKVELGITQQKVYRTGAGADHRLTFNPTFEGQVRPTSSYLILDDTLKMGGTIASLRGYIENRAGKVIGASVMTAHPGAVDLAVKPTMLEAIARKHGPCDECLLAGDLRLWHRLPHPRRSRTPSSRRER